MKLADVQKNYDRVAKRYDGWTEFFFGQVLGVEQLRQHTIELLGDLQGKVVLDIGCGTGRNFPFLISQVGSSGRIIGVDYSEGMLAVARARIEREGWKNVDLRTDDAAKLATIDATVGAVVSVWCMGIVYDLDAALGRALDVLEPNGRIAIMDFDRVRPDHGLLRWTYPLYSRVLRLTGIDSAEDLDDARLREKWKRGRAILESRTEHLEEERYLSGGGIILAGTAPNRGKPR